ncbi:Crp/Fnr family transcriptional regulator [Microvirga lenta]|uniref:Crp/Fnr family transcriptional regulator n=1 Tax=Microvirga lenta TaxID=2881337 RepID=UPI001CFFBEDF|nr:Crp/Fnr family transcriptional regulator [Microvirga lenta]MCB5177198.1 Crp/Fnr family transcriptional regulator [Microvirga lenta]
MASLQSPPPFPLVLKLESITDLSPEERQALLGLPLRVQEFRADQDVVREGDRPIQCCLILEGFACRYKLTEKGKRQIFAFHTPGDIPDLQSLHLKTMDHSLGTLTPCKIAFIQHEHLRELFRQHPRLAEVFWRDTLIDAAIFREWMLGIGRRSARTRLAHLLCELFMRLKVIGLAGSNSIPLPLSQAEMGDALGLSTVHINRTLQELRGEDLVAWDGGILTILNWEGLMQAGEFDTTYLHLQDCAAA